MNQNNNNSNNKNKYLYPIIISLIVIGFFSFIIALAIEVKDSGLRRKNEINIITETREVKDFNKIKMIGIGKLDIVQGENESLTISADEEDMKKIITEVNENTLTISNKDLFDNRRITLFNYDRQGEISYTLTVKDLNTLDIEGAAQVFIKNLETDSFELHQEGAADTKIRNLVVKSANIYIKGVGATDIEGSADSGIFTIEGFGDFNARDFVVKDLKLNSKGTGSIQLHATELLDLKVEGISDIEYYGDAKVTQKLEGLSEVTKMD